MKGFGHRKGKDGARYDKIKGNKAHVKTMAGKAAKPVFKETAKKPETDDLPGKMRKAAHAPKQAGVARRSKHEVKKLSNQVI